VTGIEDLKEETEAEAKAKVKEVLQKGLRLAPSDAQWFYAACSAVGKVHGRKEGLDQFW
jgi:hypothetical protein